MEDRFSNFLQKQQLFSNVVYMKQTLFYANYNPSFLSLHFLN